MIAMSTGIGQNRPVVFLKGGVINCPEKTANRPYNPNDRTGKGFFDPFVDHGLN
jgi:hypothetical protein